MSKGATIIEHTTIEDCRSRLEGRIKAFHRKADTFMNLEDIEEDMIAENRENREWESLDKWDINNDLDAGQEKVSGNDESCADPSSDSEDGDEDKRQNDEHDDEDEHEESQYPECMSLCLPSSLGKQVIEYHSLQDLAKQEIQLRIGQANDALVALRLELGHRALLFRTVVRRSRNTKGKTRAWKQVNQSSMEVLKHVRCYHHAQRALMELGADKDTLEKYQDIQKKDLKMSADMLKENRFGQRNDTLAWFWQMGQPSNLDGNQ